MRFWIICVTLFVPVLFSARLIAGPYPPAADEEGTTAVYMDDTAFGGWASGYVEPVNWGEGVADEWKTPNKALGMARGTVSDICSLGRGGKITLTFDAPIPNREGCDFAVFENGFSNSFLELAYVEVSSNGEDFVRFKVYSLTPNPVGAYGTINTTDIDGFAGKYRMGYGTPFDMEELADDPLVVDGTVDINAITHIRIIDVIGNGNETDEDGRPIFDPYPTTGSAGFDLEAVGVLVSEPTIPWILVDGSGAGSGCFIATAAFGSPLERHVATFRAFRDRYLLSNAPGRIFVNAYYRYSPPVAAVIANHDLLRLVIRASLFPLFYSSRFMLCTTTAQKAAAAIILVVLFSFCILTANRVRVSEKDM
jgi:hypothetical protein